MSKKDMSASNTSPLEQLLGGGVVLGSERGVERGQGAFTEVIEEGWKTMDPSELQLGKGFAGVNFDEKILVAPQDESRDAFLTRIHNVGHIVLSPHETPKSLEVETGIPADVINAFEDGRVNGRLMREVSAFAETIDELPFPIDVGMLERSVENAAELREEGVPGAFTENEIRAFGACLMAASESYSPNAGKVWEKIADVTGMSPEQKEYVVDACHRLHGMTFEEMVDEVQHMMNLLVEDIIPPEPVAPPPVCEEPSVGVGPASDKGTDYEEPDSGTVAVEEIAVVNEVERVERPKPKPVSADTKKALKRIAPRAASIDPIKPRAANNKAVGAPTAIAASVADPSKRSRYIAQHYAYTQEVKESEATSAASKSSKADLSGAMELVKDFGVTVAEENHVGGRLGGRGGEAWKRPDMKLKEYDLTEEVTIPIGNPRKAKKHDRVGYLTTPFRAHIDGKIMRRKMRVRRLDPAGAILLDLSGSMRPSSKLIRRCIEIAPYAVIGAYAGNDAGKGFFTIVARDRKCVSQTQLQRIIEEFGGGNSVDYEALEWLSQQKGPRVWISDGMVCGSGTDESVNIHMCFQLARDKEIIRIPDLRMLVGEQPLVNNLRHVTGT